MGRIKMKNYIMNFLRENGFEFDKQYSFDDVANAVLDVCQNCDDVRFRVSNLIDRSCHRDDIVMELDYRNIQLDDETIDAMVEVYEDKLGDSEEWHYILNYVIDRFVGENDD